MELTHLTPDPSSGVTLSELAARTGTSVRKLSTLAITECFPSVASATNRRVVHPRVADALVVLLEARLDLRPLLRAVFRDPPGVARATGRVAEILADRSGEAGG